MNDDTGPLRKFDELVSHCFDSQLTAASITPRASSKDQGNHFSVLTSSDSRIPYLRFSDEDYENQRKAFLTKLAEFLTCIPPSQGPFRVFARELLSDRFHFFVTMSGFRCPGHRDLALLCRLAREAVERFSDETTVTLVVVNADDRQEVTSAKPHNIMIVFRNLIVDRFIAESIFQTFAYAVYYWAHVEEEDYKHKIRDLEEEERNKRHETFCTNRKHLRSLCAPNDTGDEWNQCFPPNTYERGRALATIRSHAIDPCPIKMPQGNHGSCAVCRATRWVTTSSKPYDFYGVMDSHSRLDLDGTRHMNRNFLLLLESLVVSEHSSRPLSPLKSAEERANAPAPPYREATLATQRGPRLVRAPVFHLPPIEDKGKLKALQWMIRNSNPAYKRFFVSTFAMKRSNCYMVQTFSDLNERFCQNIRACHVSSRPNECGTTVYFEVSAQGVKQLCNSKEVCPCEGTRPRRCCRVCNGGGEPEPLPASWPAARVQICQAWLGMTTTGGMSEVGGGGESDRLRDNLATLGLGKRSDSEFMSRLVNRYIPHMEALAGMGVGANATGQAGEGRGRGRSGGRGGRGRGRGARAEM